MTWLAHKELPVAYGGKHEFFAVTYNVDDLKTKKQYSQAFRYQRIMERMRTSIKRVETLGIQELEHKKAKIIALIKEDLDDLQVMYCRLNQICFIDMCRSMLSLCLLHTDYAAQLLMIKYDCSLSSGWSIQ